jgi:hypothetical protein
MRKWHVMFKIGWALNTRRIKKVRTILEYFCCMIGSTAEAWSCCSSRSDGDMLRVWFSCPFVPNECGVKMVATLEVCTKDEHPALWVQFQSRPCRFCGEQPDNVMAFSSHFSLPLPVIVCSCVTGRRCGSGPTSQHVVTTSILSCGLQVWSGFS